ncbi:hypothetical protein M9Y10_025483 [Tritrichomonas musculus]|uniref:Uncharacterized protein n=1 Tax=Tritrichomonas musculus TaxID=1915356 RepID=A0ABR2H8U1_9EUKA
MLISNSRKPKISRNLLKEIAASQVHINYKLSTKQSLSLDALSINFIENLQKSCITDGYQKNLNKFLDIASTNDFLSVLHSIISNQQLIYIRSQALYSLHHAMKCNSCLIVNSNFFTTEVIDFYSRLLFDCDQVTELFSLSIINSILFKFFEDSKILLFKYDLPSLLINSDPDSVSPLFVSFSSEAMPDKMSLLFENGFIDHYIQKLLNLISSKSIETSSNAMESLILLLQNNPGIKLNNLDFLQNEFIHNLYSEDERCIELTLKLMVIVNLPPIGHINMIYLFVECHWTKISVEAIKLIQYFSPIFSQEDLVESKNVFLRALSRQPFKVEYLSLMTLLSTPFLSLLNLDEKKYLLDSLIIYSNDEDLCEQCLKSILMFHEQQDQNVKKMLVDIITQEYQLFEKLSWSENENVAKLAQQILIIEE